MVQLSLFPTMALQTATAKQMETSPLRSSITANVYHFSDDDNYNERPLATYDGNEQDFGDIYDEYIDFDVCAHSW